MSARKGRTNSVTTVEIASKVGVSQSTVINILNDTPGLKYSAQTRERVLQAARELGYQKSLLRRAIKRPLRTLGVLISSSNDLESTFYHSILNGIYRGAMESNYTVMLLEAQWTLGDMEDAKSHTKKHIEMVMSGLVDGLLIDKSRFGLEQLALLEEAEVPFVCLNGRVPKPAREVERAAYWVCIDHAQGGRLATEHLIGQGHRRIALINPELSHYPPEFMPGFISSRIRGYREAMADAGLQETTQMVEASLTDRAVVNAAVETLMAGDGPPTAILAADDSIAILVINCLRRLGFDVPADVSVMGYGNWHAAFLADPALTTVDVPWELMGKLSVEVLASVIARWEMDQTVHILETTVKAGASVGRRRDGR